MKVDFGENCPPAVFNHLFFKIEPLRESEFLGLRDSFEAEIIPW